MSGTLVDMESWDRREIYDLFSRSGWPFVSVTMPVDVTAVKAYTKAYSLSFYHTMIWLCTRALNAVPEFRMRIREGRVYLLDRADPSFTDIKPGSRAFRIVTLPWEEDLAAFCAHAKAKSEAQQGFLAHNDETDELIYFSCTPWFDFTGLAGDRDGGADDAIPHVTWGRYFSRDDRLWVHLALEVNHRTVDGFHIGEFKRLLDEEIAALTPG